MPAFSSDQMDEVKAGVGGPAADPNAPQPESQCQCEFCRKRRERKAPAEDKAKHPLRKLAALLRKDAEELLTVAEGYDRLADLSDSEPFSPQDKALAYLYKLATAKFDD